MSGRDVKTDDFDPVRAHFGRLRPWHIVNVKSRFLFSAHWECAEATLNGLIFGMIDIAEYFFRPSNQPCSSNLGERLDAYRGWTTGFDYLRVFLAVAVIGWHSVFTCYGVAYEVELYTSWIRPIIYPILPMFFSLGGFLVTASLLRTNSFDEYLLLRVLRFFPALLTVVVISACIVGPLLTSERLSDYFGSHQFRAYFLNAFGYFEGRLPGVFLTNPTPRVVNVSLWTIPWEFGCSIVLYALMLCRESLRGKLLFAISLLASIVIPLLAILSKHEASIFTRPPGHLLVLSFIAGACFYFFRYKIVLDFRFFALCGALAFILLLNGRSSYLAPVPIAYVTIYLGVLNPPKYGLMKRADISYGMAAIPPSRLQHGMLLDVANGSIASFGASADDFWSTPENGHSAVSTPCLKQANGLNRSRGKACCGRHGQWDSAVGRPVLR